MHRLLITVLTLATIMMLAPAVTAAPAHAAAAKPNLRACYDGKCKFTFTRPVSFRVAKRYRLGRVRVARVYNGAFGGHLVQVSGPGLVSTLSEGARGTLNGLSFRVLAITSRGATIRFTG
ncbi:hypothetical protein DP939_30380 [Spongiactinospora rosea]|uniref:Uncharacterized protein n=1 Tax=Spongiactinospora rosea TaxID=2248750 RepID=A0A366LSB3_9ACTN|nr:hypothetical protein [Spongiactinospora rosea]RBQ16279.1 hypothetical protein DP939_30380 [Spongiactinospora rosea]